MSSFLLLYSLSDFFRLTLSCGGKLRPSLLRLGRVTLDEVFYSSISVGFFQIYTLYLGIFGRKLLYRLTFEHDGYAVAILVVRIVYHGYKTHILVFDPRRTKIAFVTAYHQHTFGHIQSVKNQSLVSYALSAPYLFLRIKRRITSAFEMIVYAHSVHTVRRITAANVAHFGADKAVVIETSIFKPQKFGSDIVYVAGVALEYRTLFPRRKFQSRQIVLVGRKRLVDYFIAYRLANVVYFVLYVAYLESRKRHAEIAAGFARIRLSRLFVCGISPVEFAVVKLVLAYSEQLHDFGACFVFRNGVNIFAIRTLYRAAHDRAHVERSITGFTQKFKYHGFRSV